MYSTEDSLLISHLAITSVITISSRSERVTYHSHDE